jgi:hypothetical protein|tara:strand:- start:3072 stop:3326 length:255 start_codon:yes stop_codon:yes gene_type:complete
MCTISCLVKIGSFLANPGSNTCAAAFVELRVGVSSHFLQYPFANNLVWRFPSKALAWSVVEAIADHLHIVICALPDVAFAGIHH